MSHVFRSQSSEGRESCHNIELNGPMKNIDPYFVNLHGTQ